MKYRRLSATGDYVFGSNASDFVLNDEAVSQAIKTKVLLFYGEWFENVSIGIPMFQSILGQVSNQNLQMSITLLVTNRIMEVPEVKSVDNISVKVDGRSITLEVDVTTTYGTQTSTEVVV